MAKGITRSKSVLVAAGGVAAGTGAFADQIDTVAGAFSATQSAVGSAVGLQATIAALLDGPAVPWFLLAMTICALGFVLWRYALKAGRGDIVIR